MPGQLKSSACCPVCGVPLVALVDESSSAGVRRKFYHDKDPQASAKARRPLPCTKVFGSSFIDCESAQRERRALEVRGA